MGLRKRNLIIGMSLGAVLLVLLFLFSLLQRHVEQQILEKVNSNIDGKITAASVHVGLTGMEIREPRLLSSKGKEVMRAAALSIRYSLPGLLVFRNKAAAVKDIALRSPRAVIERDSSGKFVIVSIFTTRKMAFDWKAALGGFGAGLKVIDGSFEYRDRERDNFSATLYPVHMELKPGRKSSFSFSLSADEKGFPGTRLKGRGSLSLRNPRVEFDFTGDSLDLGFWGSYCVPHKDIAVTAGRASFEMALRGSSSSLDTLLPALFLTGKLSIAEGAAECSREGISLRDLAGKLEINRNYLLLRGFTGRVNDAPFSLKGSLSDFQNPSLDIDAAVSGLALKHLKRLESLKPLEGRVWASLNCAGPPQSPSVRGVLQCPRAVVKGNTLTDVRVEGSYQEGAVHIPQLTLKYQGSLVSGRGWIFTDTGKLLFALQGASSPFVLDLQQGKSLSGSAAFAVTMLGSLSSPSIIGHAAASRLMAGEKSLGKGEASFLLHDSTLCVENGILRTGGGALSTSGVVDLNSRECDLTVRGVHYPVPAMSLSPGNLLTGEISGSLQVSGSFDSPLISGAVSGGSLAMGGHSLKGLFVPFATDGTFLSVSHARAVVSGSPVRFSGNFLLSPDPFMQVSVACNDVENLTRSMASSLPFVMQNPAVLQATFSGSPGLGFLWDATAVVDRGRVSSRGFSPSLHSDRWLGYLSLHEVPLSGLVRPRDRSVELKGRVEEGDVLLSGRGSSVYCGCSLSFLDASLMGFPFSSLYGDMNCMRNLLSIDSAALRGSAGTVSLGGTLDMRKGTYAVKGEGTELDTEYLVKNLLLGPLGLSVPRSVMDGGLSSVKGLATVGGTFSNEGKSPAFEGRIAIAEGVYNNENLSFSSRLSVMPHHALIRDLSFCLGQSSYGARGTVNYSPPFSVDMMVHSQKGDISRLLAFSPWRGLDLQGSLDGDFQIRGKSDSFLVDGTMLVKGLIFKGQPLDELEATLHSQDRNLILDKFRARFKEGELTGKGIISSAGKLSLDIASTHFPLGELEIAEKYLGKLKGDADLAIRIEGTRDNPDVELVFDAANVEVAGEHFEAGKGTFHWKNSTLTVDSLTLAGSGERYSLSGTLSSPGMVLPLKGTSANPLVDLKAEVSNARLETLLQLLPSTPFHDLKGRIDGHVEVKGKLSDPSFSIDVELKEGALKKVPLSKGIAKLAYDQHHLTIDRLAVQTPDSSLSVKGTMGSGDENDLEVDIHNLDLGAIPCPLAFKLGGRLDVKARLSGSLQFPDVVSSVKMKKGRIGGFDFDGMQGTVTAKKGVFTISDCSFLEKNSHIAVRGNAPLMFEGRKVVSTAPMRLQAELKEKDFDLLSLFMPLEGSTSGTMAGALEVSGLIPDLTLEGSLSLKDGEIQPSPLRKPITGINGVIRFADEKIALKNIRGRMGQGEFAIGGEIDLSHSKLKHIDLKVKGRDLAVAGKEYFNGLADIDLALEGDDGGKALRGSVTTRNAMMKIPLRDLMRDSEDRARLIAELKKSIPPQLADTAVKVGINLDKDTWLSFLSSSFMTRGSLSLMGQIPDLALVGEVDLYRGTVNIPLFETPFKVYQGKAYFDGESWSPYMDMSAEADLGKYVVYMNIMGKLDSPKLDISSEPPMQRADIEQMLTGERPSFYTGAAFQADAMTTRLAERMLDQSLVQPLFHAIGRTFALTDVSLEYSYLGCWSVKLAKALDAKERMLITFEKLMGPQGEYQRLFGLEYRLPRGMLLRVSQDDTGNSYFWVQSRHSF